MRFLTISPENQQRLAIAVPVIALLLSLFVVYPTWQRYTGLQATIKTQQRELEALQATPLPDVGTVPPAEPGVPSEPPKFLGQLRLIAQLANCHVKDFDISGAAKQEAGPVRAVRARINLEGRYAQIRDFLFRLGQAPRLYVVTDCSLAVASKPGAAASNSQAATPPGTVLANIEIERYTTPPGT